MGTRSGDDAGRPDRDHGQSPRLMSMWLAVYLALTALFAVVTSEEAQRDWSLISIPGYAIAFVVSRYKPTRRWSAPVAVFLAVVVPTVVLVGTGIGQPEVQVVRDGAHTWLHTGTPYLADPQSVYEYRPYLPATFLLGSLPGFLGDIRTLGMVLLTLALVAIRTLRSPPPTSRACSVEPGQDANRRALGILHKSGLTIEDQRSCLLLSCPIVALAAAGSGIDIPQASLTLLAVVLLARDRSIAAGLLLGFTLGMKPTALCVLFVFAVFTWRRDGAARAFGLVSAALGVALVFVGPVAAIDPHGLWENVILFPSGRAGITSPAESPFPGVLVRQLGAPHWAQALLLLAAAAAVAVWCFRRLTDDVYTVAECVAVGLTAAFLFVPYSRAGYLVLPALVYFPVRILMKSTRQGTVSGSEERAIP